VSTLTRESRPLRSWLGRRLADLQGTVWLRKCDHVGAGAYLVGAPHVENLGRIVIGESFRLRSVPVVSHLVTGPKGLLEIGAGVEIGHGAAIAVHAHVCIGDRVKIGPFVMIMDTDFHEVGDRNAAPESRPVLIGNDVRIGSGVTILRGASIGVGAEVAAGSVVAGDVPAGARVAGVPARVLGPGESESTAPEATLPRIRQVVVNTFGLGREPADTDGPQNVRGWDSLGTLNLLLSLEDAFGITLREQDLLDVRSVADLLGVVAAAQARR
jgi:acetyltransferase-like isoleucine patch superfamily enzyme